jgi:hypothetical protein
MQIALLPVATFFFLDLISDNFPPVCFCHQWTVWTSLRLNELKIKDDSECCAARMSGVYPSGNWQQLHRTG